VLMRQGVSVRPSAWPRLRTMTPRRPPARSRWSGCSATTGESARPTRRPAPPAAASATARSPCAATPPAAHPDSPARGPAPQAAGTGAPRPAPDAPRRPRAPRAPDSAEATPPAPARGTPPRCPTHSALPPGTGHALGSTGTVKARPGVPRPVERPADRVPDRIRE
jgi:hypothetical protein